MTKKQVTKGGPTPESLKAYSELLGRMQLASMLGLQFTGDRDIYTTLGYDKKLTYAKYCTQYARQDIAAAIIDRPVDATWRGPLAVLEADDNEETPFEKAWRELEKTLKLKSRFVRLDKLTSLGQYGVLMLGLSDTKTKEDYAKPVMGKNLQLLYVKPLGEGSASIADYQDDVQNPRYGLPESYDIVVQDKRKNTSNTLRVHHSRIIHVCTDLLESEVKGTPALQKVFNRLKDLEKLIGGSAEMFWKGARPGYQANVEKDFSMDEKSKTEIKAQIDEYEHGLRRILTTEGVELKDLASQVSDPSNHVDVQIQMISAITGIPKRILVGSERGELASSQDKETWLEMVQDRREEYAEQAILFPFVDRCMEYGILPKVETYSMKWKDLFAVSDKDQAEVGKTRATALKEYTQNPAAEMIVPPQAFFEFFLGLSPDEITQIETMQQAAMDEEEREIASTPDEIETDET